MIAGEEVLELFKVIDEVDEMQSVAEVGDLAVFEGVKEVAARDLGVLGDKLKVRGSESWQDLLKGLDVVELA